MARTLHDRRTVFLKKIMPERRTLLGVRRSGISESLLEFCNPYLWYAIIRTVISARKCLIFENAPRNLSEYIPKSRRLRGAFAENGSSEKVFVTNHVLARFIGKEGDAVEDYQTIYTQYFGDEYKYLLTLCRDPVLAEEITQETFFKALKSLDSFRGQCYLTP